MFRPLEACVGLRYTRARRRNGFIAFISLVALLGAALGVASLITVMSVMNGFEDALRGRILAMTAHASIQDPASGVLASWPERARQAEAQPGVAATAPYVRMEAMLSHDARVSGAVVRGVLPDREQAVSEVASRVVAGRIGSLRPGAFNVILGSELAYALGVAPGDRVSIVAPEANVTPLGLVPRLKRFHVSGIFQSGSYEFDRGLALVHMEDAIRLFRVQGGVSGLRLRVDDVFDAPAIARALAPRLPPGLVVRDWTQDHASLFRAVQIEKTAMFVILSLLVAVAAFNIVSTLVMAVTDKRADIAILRTLGATPASIMTIFIIQGLVVGVSGVLMGIGGGVLLALNVDAAVRLVEGALGVSVLSPEAFYIAELPSRLLWSDVIGVGVVGLVLMTAATLYPAWQAGRLQPARSLGHG